MTDDLITLLGISINEFIRSLNGIPNSKTLAENTQSQLQPQSQPYSQPPTPFQNNNMQVQNVQKKPCSSCGSMNANNLQNTSTQSQVSPQDQLIAQTLFLDPKPHNPVSEEQNKEVVFNTDVAHIRNRDIAKVMKEFQVDNTSIKFS